jgi:hypothetical protein
MYVWTVCVLKSVLRKIRVGPELPERNYCENPGVPVSMFRQYEIDTARNLCLCPSVLTYCDFIFFRGKTLCHLGLKAVKEH